MDNYRNCYVLVRPVAPSRGTLLVGLQERSRPQERAGQWNRLGPGVLCRSPAGVWAVGHMSNGSPHEGSARETEFSRASSLADGNLPRLHPSRENQGGPKGPTAPGHTQPPSPPAGVSGQPVRSAA